MSEATSTRQRQRHHRIEREHAEHLQLDQAHLLTALKELHGKKMLLRIVCEEVHIMLTDSHYRECTLQVPSFFSKLSPIPIVSLTGSLTRDQEEQIIRNILNANGKQSLCCDGTGPRPAGL